MTLTQSPIPLIDLAAQYQAIKPEIEAAIQRVLTRGQFILGPEVEGLEREMAAYCGTSEAVAVASGTDALELTLRGCGIGPGDEVLTTALSFFATAETIVSVGATPVFVDVDPVTLTMDPAQAEQKRSPRTKAILPVHLYGHPCAMDELQRMATQHGFVLIEDCAQAIGARYRDRRVGSFGTAGCFSFYPTKNLGAYGDGGMVITNDAALAEEIRLLRTHGSRDKVQHVRISRNSRLDDLQAAILRVKLPYLEAWTAKRRQHADTYRTLIEQAGFKGVALPHERPGCWHVYHLYVIRCRQRDLLRKALVAQGIGAQIHYHHALPHQPALSFLKHTQGEFPVAEQAASEVLSLPLYPELTPALIQTVVDHLRDALEALAI